MTIRANLQAVVNRTTRDTWGQPASYTPASTGVAESITAVFDAAHAQVELQGEVPISTLRPVLRLRTADLSVAPAQGDSVTISGTAYEVNDTQPDSSGMTLCTLYQVT